MPDIDLDELYAEFEELAPAQRQNGRSARDERIIAGFEEIQRFVEEHRRSPQHGEDRDIFERIYAVRLDRLRTLPDCRALLSPLDHQNLLSAAQSAGAPDHDRTDPEELMADLEEFDSGGEIAELRHVRTTAEKHAAEEIADRSACRDFEKYASLFEQVRADLKSGLRQALAVHRLDEIKLDAIKEGQFFIVGGQVAYIAAAGEEFETGYDRRDSRLRVIYDNRTESNLLMRSFQRSLYRDEAGRLITNPDLGPLFATNTSHE